MTPLDSLTNELPEAPGYRAVSVVGAGSRSCVYRARDLATEDIVALKVFAPSRFESPAEAQARLDAALARLRTVESADLVIPTAALVVDSPATVALAMQMIDGEALSHSMQRGVRFQPERAVRISSTTNTTAPLMTARSG